MKPNYKEGKPNSEKRHFSWTLNFVACDGVCTRPVNKGYLIFDTLHQGFALRHHHACHLLPSLSHCENLELHRFSFLKTISLVGHTHNPKGDFLAFTCPWNKEGRMVDILFVRAVNVNILIHIWTPTFLYDFNEPLVFWLGGIYAA